MDGFQIKREIESPFPFWMATGRSSSSRASTKRIGNLAAFLATTSRLPMYEPDRLIKIKPLGSGTSFQAEACKDIKTDTVVVVKCLRAGSSSGDGLDSSVLQELKVSVYPPFLKHQNIIRTLGFAISGSAFEDVFSVSLVMEFAEFGSLEQYLTRTGSSGSRRDWHQLERLTIDICSGLEALHRCRVVHGDIKPENILLFPTDPSTSSSPYLAKLTDFGSSIVEDTIDEDIDAGYSQPIYRGTPLYVPCYVRKHSGRLPFHIMPSVDVYSFGLLLWSICKGTTYYERYSVRQNKGVIEYLDEIGVNRLRQHFESDLEEIARLLPEIETTRLSKAFMFCVTDVVIDQSPIAPIDREKVYREAFSSITEVRRILLQERKESSDCYDSSPSWEPFQLGTSPSKESLDNIPWNVQCELVQELLDKLKDPRQSTFRKGKAALQLSSYYAVGLGCKRNYNEVLRYFRLSATLGDSVAQIVCPRVFVTHGEPMDRFEMEDIPQSESPVDPDLLSTEDSDIDMEVSSEDGERVHEEPEADTDEPESHLMEDMSGIRGTPDSDSDADDLYAVFGLSVVFDRDFERMTNATANDYFWMKIRMFERALGFAAQAATLKFDGKWYGGFSDPNLISDLRSTWLSENQLPPIELKCLDGTLIHTPLLHHAAACGMLELVKDLVQHGASLRTVNDEGDTVLHVAMRHGYGEMTKFLVGHGAGASSKNNRDVTPLHYLSMFGGLDLVQTSEDGVPETDKLHETQVLKFDGPDIYEIGKLLINAGAEVNASMGEFDSTVDIFFSQRINGTPLHAALMVSNKFAVETLLKLGADVNLRPFQNSHTPLEVAAQLHLAEIAEILLEHGANLTSSSETGIWTGAWAMHHVGSHIQPLTRWLLHGPNYKKAAHDIILVLVNAALEQHLDLDMRDSSGLTAFETALQEGGEDDYIVEAFLNCYATLPPNALQTAVLSCVADEENASKVEFVLSHGAVLETSHMEEGDGDGFSALHLCALKGALKAAKVILEQPEACSLLHSRDDEGMTPLHCAASTGNIKMTKFFLEQGADINAWDVNGRSALGDAITHGHEALTTLLLARGADINLHAGDYEGGTILHFAIPKDSRTSNSMLVFLLSADRDDGGEAERFPQLHEQVILNAADTVQGNTALHLAAQFGDYAGIFALVAAGAEVQIKNRQGLTSLEIANRRLRSLRSECKPDEMRLARNLEKCVRHLERAGI